MSDLLDSGEAFELFKSNIDQAGTRDRVEIYRDDSDAVLKKMVGRQFDLIFAYGTHSYVTVKSDIENAMPLIRDGGILCGDDLEMLISESNPPITLKWAEMGVEYALDPASGIWFHPGVTVAVAGLFGEVWRKGAAWAVQKSAGQWVPVDAA